jgi:glutaredoxin
LPAWRVTYTDRPAVDASARVTPLGREPAPAAATPQDTLPLELRQLATRFPVTLYGAKDCPPCDAGRQLLLQRGVPFTEKQLVSDDDVVALERLTGARTVPALTIGAQVLRGLSHAEWASYLDLAGYPRESRLPKGWQPPAATPLVARSAPRPTATATPSPTGTAPSRPITPPAADAPASPSGIRF